MNRSAKLDYNKAGNAIIVVKFDFNHDDLNFVRSVPERKYIPTNRTWVLPMRVENVRELEARGFYIDDELIKLTNKQQLNINQTDVIEIPGLKKSLFPFQSKGVDFLNRKDGRALIGDDMGLGKTIQALAYLQLHQDLRPAIVVCPATVKLNWRNEAFDWMSPKPCIRVLHGNFSEFDDLLELDEDIIIINYDILSSWLEELKAIEPKVLITDECHYYKSNKAKRTQAVKRLAKNIDHVIALSGTPILSRPIEMYNALKIINPFIVADRWTYAMRYCGAKNNGFGWDFSGASNTEELNKLLTNTIMIRRTKAEVLKDLPDKLRSFVPIETDNAKRYIEAEKDFIKYLHEEKGQEAAHRARAAEHLVKIEELKQLCVRGKLKHVTEWIQEFLETTDEKLVVFAVHKFVIEHLMHKFEEYAVKIDGSVSDSKRQSAVNAFQNNDRVRLFVGNIKAAGVGITLTAASNVAFIELPWTPGELVQAEDRCHRIGQKDNVNIYYLLASDTIEERIAHLLDHKRKILDSILDGKVTEEESLLSQLIEQYV